MDPFLAEIRIFPFNFPPAHWAFCDGTLVPISQNTALFSLLGTNYGGNGKSNFALPDLQGCVPMHPGQGTGSLYEHTLGEMGGSDMVTLLESEMPFHGHTLRADTADIADTNEVSTNAAFAMSSGGSLYQTASNGIMSPYTLAPAGGSLPHNNLQPYLTMNFCIATQGVYPQRP